MLDVFGLKKTEGEPTPEPENEPSRPSSPKLWAAALVVDSLFVIVFGGAVAAKIYQHWKAPAPEAPRRSAARPPKAEPAKAPEPPKTAASPEPAKPAPKPEAKEEPKPAEPPAKAPLARPSVLSEAPKRRATPAPQGTSAAPQKARPVEFKLKAPNAKKVYLVGAFIVRGGRKEMARAEGGTWTLTLYLTPDKYRYHFNVDGKRLSDPENPSSSIVVAPQ